MLSLVSRMGQASAPLRDPQEDHRSTPLCPRRHNVIQTHSQEGEDGGDVTQISQEKACGCLREKVEIKTCRGFSYPALKLKSNLDGNGCIGINRA